MISFLILAALSLFYVVTVFCLTKVVRELNHQNKRERAAHKQTVTELIDRLMHSQGNTWTPPPREIRDEDDKPDEETQRVLEGWREA